MATAPNARCQPPPAATSPLEMTFRRATMAFAMDAILSGKWVWIWNWRRCDDGDPARVAERLKAAGCRGALIKAHDGPYWFDQGQSWREIGRALKSFGLKVAGWAYLYGRDWPGEAQRALETIGYGEADAYVLDVESEFKHRPDVAEALCRRIREGAGPEYPLYYSSFAIARYHREFPYAAFERYCSGALPMVYWNAFRWPVEQALAWTYEDYAALGAPPERLFPVAGAYREGYVPYPSPEEVRRFGEIAREGGSPGISFWSYEHMDESMWQAVASIPWSDATADIERLRREKAELEERIARAQGRAEETVRILRGDA